MLSCRPSGQPIPGIGSRSHRGPLLSNGREGGLNKSEDRREPQPIWLRVAAARGTGSLCARPGPARFRADKLDSEGDIRFEYAK